MYSSDSGLAQVAGLSDESSGKVWCLIVGNYLSSLKMALLRGVS